LPIGPTLQRQKLRRRSSSSASAAAAAGIRQWPHRSAAASNDTAAFSALKWNARFCVLVTFTSLYFWVRFHTKYIHTGKYRLLHMPQYRKTWRDQPMTISYFPPSRAVVTWGDVVTWRDVTIRTHSRPIIYGIFWTPHSSMEGPKVPSEARRREAPQRRGGWGLGRGTVALPSMGVWGPQKIFQKINVEIAYFSSFLQAKMHRRRSDFKSGGAHWIFFTVPLNFYLVPTLMGGHVPSSLQYE